jgi:DNA processing protein
VFAVAGHPLDLPAEGTNRLIRAGATMITSAADVLETLAPMIGRSAAPADAARPACAAPSQLMAPLPFDMSQDERGAVTAALGPAPVHVDDILRATGLDVAAVQVALHELDLAGRLEHHGAQIVSLKRAM